jgi:hypothetical protein
MENKKRNDHLLIFVNDRLQSVIHSTWVVFMVMATLQVPENGDLGALLQCRPAMLSIVGAHRTGNITGEKGPPRCFRMGAGALPVSP